MNTTQFGKAMAEAIKNTSIKGAALSCLDAQSFFSCPTCGKRLELCASNFKDAISVREWCISGMCQECQDGIFELIPEEDFGEDDTNCARCGKTVDECKCEQED